MASRAGRLGFGREMTAALRLLPQSASGQAALAHHCGLVGGVEPAAADHRPAVDEYSMDIGRRRVPHQAADRIADWLEVRLHCVEHDEVGRRVTCNAAEVRAPQNISAA